MTCKIFEIDVQCESAKSACSHLLISTYVACVPDKLLLCCICTMQDLRTSVTHLAKYGTCVQSFVEKLLVIASIVTYLKLTMYICVYVHASLYISQWLIGQPSVNALNLFLKTSFSMTWISSCIIQLSRNLVVSIYI